MRILIIAAAAAIIAFMIIGSMAHAHSGKRVCHSHNSVATHCH